MMISLSIILTIIRLIRIVDFKKLVIFDFLTDEEGKNNKDKKKNNLITLLELDIDAEWKDF
jgi:hypothetical protein